MVVTANRVQLIIWRVQYVQQGISQKLEIQSAQFARRVPLQPLALHLVYHVILVIIQMKAQMLALHAVLENLLRVKVNLLVQNALSVHILQLK